MNLPQVLLLIAAALAGAVLLGILARRIRLPETVVLALFGMLIGTWLRDVPLQNAMRSESFEHILVFVFLPLLVFSEALSLSTRAFFRNLLPILVLAIPAVLISTVFVGGAVSLVLGIPLVAALLFGGLISATDPVAVVAIFRQLGVPERLLMLVEGESLLNDGVAIVLYEILLFGALGHQISVGGGVLEFLRVFLGGTVLGALLGFGVALMLPWLSRAPAVALSVALAYGSYVLADDVLGVSGVMASAAAGLVVSGFAPSRASHATRVAWQEVWDGLSFIANALLFLLIGLAIDLRLLQANLGPMALAVVAVFVARALGVIPLVSALERLAHIPAFGWRNVSVLIWGGLRGGVALALALALPEEFAYRETVVAMTGGVVFATLLINATTIGVLVHKLGLNQPGRPVRFLGLAARLDGLRAARTRLAQVDLNDSVVEDGLRRAELEVRGELQRLQLSEEEQTDVMVRRGLAVEHETYQRLRDVGLLPPSAAMSLLTKVGDQIEDVMTGSATEEREAQQEVRPWWRWLQQLVAKLPQPLTHDPDEVAYAEASARRLASHRARAALDFFQDLPNISQSAVQQARATFERWEQVAIKSLEDLDQRVGDLAGEIHHKQAEAVSRMAAREELEALADLGILPQSIAEQVSEQIPGKR